jgi:hypothetical protein
MQAYYPTSLSLNRRSDYQYEDQGVNRNNAECDEDDAPQDSLRSKHWVQRDDPTISVGSISLGVGVALDWMTLVVWTNMCSREMMTAALIRSTRGRIHGIADQPPW